MGATKRAPKRSSNEGGKVPKHKVRRKGRKGDVMEMSLSKFFEPVERPIKEIRKDAAGKR